MRGRSAVAAISLYFPNHVMISSSDVTKTWTSLNMYRSADFSDVTSQDEAINGLLNINVRETGRWEGNKMQAKAAKPPAW